ncbi:thiamine phosphate synthase [Geothrix sp. 21YS21S-4]|uniref:thiamine phosphate synthase n=1 Tax=Geothrix sp. 21YS21S-4 TaxID=3068889 RepID=UPI0027B98C77|nr:thiamine phosphate synthase [Geothrix sp. 21YS21S-4]
MILLAVTPGLGFDRDRWASVLRSGVDAFLIREGALSARALLDAARWCQDVAPEVALWMGGRLDVAFAAGCGLHAPERHPEVPAGLVPLSRPLHVEGQWSSRRDCDQLLVSPVFSSPGKGEPWGAGRFRAFLDALPAEGPRILALGGVEPDRMDALRHPRLAGIAAIRPFWEGDPRRAVAAFRD